MFKFILILFIISILNAQPVKLNKIFTIGYNEILMKVVDCKVIENKLYVLDAGNYSLNIYNDEGEFIQNVGRKGEGPSEFRGGVRKILLDNQRILILDKSLGTLLHEFDYRLNFVTTKRKNGGVTDLYICNDNFFVTDIIGALRARNPMFYKCDKNEHLRY